MQQLSQAFAVIGRIVALNAMLCARVAGEHVSPCEALCYVYSTPEQRAIWRSLCARRMAA